MPNVRIDQEHCRGCRMCIDRCPVNVFASDLTTDGVAELTENGNTRCMGCLTCLYACPSQCIQVTDMERQRPFYRVEEHVAFVRNFLQVDELTEDLTEDDWNEAYQDVSSTLLELVHSIAESSNRVEALGYQAGIKAALHFPDIYKTSSFDQQIQQLRQKLLHCFNFELEKRNGEALAFKFNSCAILPIVSKVGEHVGESILCQIFHAFFAGLISELSDKDYDWILNGCGSSCLLELSV